MRRYLSALLLTGALLAPAAVIGRTQDRDDDHDRDHHYKRYYDRDARDWHVWNDREDRAYRHYVEERHETYVEWPKVTRERQRDYWKWRHEHPDSQLFPEDKR